MPAAAPLPGPLRCSAINHSTCARRASSEHCRVRAECCVSCGARLSRRRKQKHEQVIEPGRALGWGLGVLGGRFDHIILLVARGRIQSIVALLNPASSYYQAKTEDACIRSGGRRPDSPGGRDRPHRAHDAMRRPSEISNEAWRRMRTAQARCTGLPDNPPWRLARSRLTPGTSLRRVRPRYPAGPRRDANGTPGPSPRA